MTPRGMRLALLLCALSACSEDRASPMTTPTSAASPAPIVSAPAEPAAATASVAREPRVEDRSTIHFGGFGPAAFGSDEAALRGAWGQALEGAKPDTPDGCYYLFPAPRPQGGYGTAFMFEGLRFVRIDVDNPDIAAPGGGRIGMRDEEIEAIYAGRIASQPHHYVEDARYLRIADADGRPGVLLFETDATGLVTRWRIGIAPQIDYVEGCS